MDGDNIWVDPAQVDCASLIEALKWLRKNKRKYSTLWKDVEEALAAIAAEKGGGQ